MGQCGCGIIKALICAVLAPCFLCRTVVGGSFAASCGLTTAFTWHVIDYSDVIINAIMGTATLPGAGLPWGFRANDDMGQGHWTAGTMKMAQIVALVGLCVNMAAPRIFWHTIKLKLGLL
jgi:hypothetical protein